MNKLNLLANIVILCFISLYFFSCKTLDLSFLQENISNVKLLQAKTNYQLDEMAGKLEVLENISRETAQEINQTNSKF